MARAITEQFSGTVLRPCGVAIRGQLLDFKIGQVIAVDGGVRDRLEGCPIAWDGEVPPHSSTLDVNEHGLAPGTM